MNKIVVITSSARKKGNCRRLADAFSRRLQEAGCRVPDFDAGALKTSLCLSDSPSEWGSGSDQYKEWFDRLEAEMKEADAVVIVVPVYIYGMPSQITAVFERLLKDPERRKAFSGKKSMLISCCAQKRMSVFNGVRAIYENIADACGWDNAGELLLTSLWKEDDADRMGATDKAYAFAGELLGGQGSGEGPAAGEVASSVIGAFSASSIL